MLKLIQVQIDDIREKFEPPDSFFELVSNAPVITKLDNYGEALKDIESLLQEGDEIWFVSSEEIAWATLCGGAGFGLYRDGKMIYYGPLAIN